MVFVTRGLFYYDTSRLQSTRVYRLPLPATITPASAMLVETMAGPVWRLMHGRSSVPNPKFVCRRQIL